MQQISIASFLANGHDVLIYAYEELSDVPGGAVVKDAREILPAAEVFRNPRENTYTAFADFFRYKLLLDRGGWWSDLDMICLKPFLFEEPYVFSAEYGLSFERANGGVTRAPAGSELMDYAWKICRTKDKRSLRWNEVGADLLAEAIARFHLQQYVKGAIVFCPLPAPDWYFVTQPAHHFRFHRKTHAIHLWHEAWRSSTWDVGIDYAPGCLYEQFKARFLRKMTVRDPHIPYELM